MVDDYLLDVLICILENCINLRGEILSLCVGELAYGPTRNTNTRSSLNHPAHFNALKHYCEVTVNVYLTVTCI